MHGAHFGLQARDIRDVHIHEAAESCPKPPNQLRSATIYFKNQVDSLAEITRWTGVSSGKKPPAGLPVVVLTGLGGMGKTELVMRWAQDAIDEFEAGSLVVDLRGSSREAPAEPGPVLERFLRALGVPAARIPDDPDERAALFRQESAGRRLLVVLDNAVSADQIHLLMPGGRGPVVIVTSRVWLRDLNAAHDAQHVRLGALPEKEAVKLLKEVMMAGGRHGDDEELITELARLCGHVPLALRIVGADAAAQPAMALADLVKDLRGERWAALSPEKGQAIQEIFSLAYRHLKPPEARTLFRALALHDGPDVSEHAAAAAAGLPGTAARKALRALTNANLLEPVPPGRYRQFNLLRDYARELIDETDGGTERRETVIRVVRWYTASVLNATRKLFPGRVFELETGGAEAEAFMTEDAARQWFDAERPNLVANAKAAWAEGLHRQVWELAMVLSPYHASHFTFDDWSVLSGLALNAADEMNDPAARASALDNRGRFLLRRGSLEEAKREHFDALAIQESIGDEPGACRSLNALGLVFFQARDLAEAIRYSTAAKNRAISADQPRWYGAASVVLAHAHLESDRPGQAIEILEPLLGFFDVRKDTLNRGTAYHLIAQARRRIGENEAARDAIARALRIAVAEKNEVWEADWLVEAARIGVALGTPDSALADCERAILLQHRVGDLGRGAEALDCKAWILEKTGQLEEAAEAHRQAAELRERPRRDRV